MACSPPTLRAPVSPARRGSSKATRGFFRGDESRTGRSAPHYDASRITDGLGARWKIGENGYKLYSCCGHTHTAVDCALEIRARDGAGPETMCCAT